MGARTDKIKTALQGVDLSKLSVEDRQKLVSLLEESRARENDTASRFSPIPGPQATAFNTPKRFLVVRGGNRSGKSTLAAALFAKRVLDYDGIGPKNGRFLVTAVDENHIGDVCYAKLFLPGEVNGSAYGVDRPPPLIPPRCIDGNIAWSNKARRIPELVKLKNGNEIIFISSGTDRREAHQGRAYDGVWIDEEVADETIPEIMRGLTDRGGWMIWAATPLARCQSMIDFHKRAERGDPDVCEVVLRTLDNIHIGEENREAFAASLQGLDPATIKTRLEGEFLIYEGAIYKNFDPAIHLIEPFRVPDHWTRWMALDPGFRVTACAWWACPPPGEVTDLGPTPIVMYREKYFMEKAIQNIAEEIVQIEGDEHVFRRYIDPASKQRHAGSPNAKSVSQQYRDYGLYFAFADNAVIAGIEKFRGLLEPVNGWPALTIFRTCHHFVDEIKLYRYNDKVEKPIKQDDHMMDCVRYLAQANPHYVPQDRQPRTFANDTYQHYFELHRDNKPAAPNVVRFG